MFNDDIDTEDEVMPSESDTELADGMEEAEEPASEAPPRAKPSRPRKRAATKKAPVKAAKAAPKPAPAKAAAKSSKKAAKATAKKSAKKSAKAATPPTDLTGVKAGAHTVWVTKELARSLTSKDRRKLKAVLKRAEKRKKTANT